MLKSTRNKVHAQKFPERGGLILGDFTWSVQSLWPAASLAAKVEALWCMLQQGSNQELHGEKK